MQISKGRTKKKNIGICGRRLKMKKYLDKIDEGR